MPIMTYGGFKRMTGFCKTRIPAELAEALEAIKDNDEAVKVGLWVQLRHGQPVSQFTSQLKSDHDGTCLQVLLCMLTRYLAQVKVRCEGTCKPDESLSFSAE